MNLSSREELLLGLERLIQRVKGSVRFLSSRGIKNRASSFSKVKSLWKAGAAGALEQTILESTQAFVTGFVVNDALSGTLEFSRAGIQAVGRHLFAAKVHRDFAHRLFAA